MKKILTTRLCIYMLIALIVTISAIFGLQTITNQSNNTASSRAKLEDVRQKLLSNEENIQNLRENLDESLLAKTRAFADILAVDPSIATDTAKLQELTDRLIVDQLHVIDKDGIIVGSSIEDYVGFDMKSGEQSNAFMVIVEDPSIEIVQEPQENVAEKTIVQYSGIARKDEKGLVQVGVRPEILQNMLAGTEIDAVLKDMDFGETGYVYAIDAASGEILAHPNTDLIGTSAVEAGFSEQFVGKGKAVIGGVKGYYVAEEDGDQVIGTFLPAGEYYSKRRSQTLLVSFSMLLIFGVLLLTINKMIDSKIVQGIYKITNSTREIADGNFDIVVEESDNPEFSLLSDNINKMVESICQNMKENEMLLERQKEDMAHNRQMIENVKDACMDLDHVSGETLDNADHIYNGTGEQEKAVEDLKQIMDRLTQELNENVSVSANVTEEMERTAEKILQTQSQMGLLTDSMQNISEMSMAIETIIGEINSIAQQTNMLSLNASIEAARAGEMGKGFAVVATQVGELAARSAQAAKETNELITNSIKAVEDGKEITNQTVEAFGIAAENIEKANQDVEKITGMVRQNVEIVSDAVNQITRIAGVVEENVRISHNTKEVSANMADVAGKLLEIVES